MVLSVSNLHSKRSLSLHNGSPQDRVNHWRIGTPKVFQYIGFYKVLTWKDSQGEDFRTWGMIKKRK